MIANFKFLLQFFVIELFSIELTRILGYYIEKLGSDLAPDCGSNMKQAQKVDNFDPKMYFSTFH